MTTITHDGFTRDRDLVAFLIYRHGHVTQFELRNAYRIKNPAQAINDAEAQFHFETETGDPLPNGDIPYRLAHGTIPNIAGTIPMFDQEMIEDAEKMGYVILLDDYRCTVCWRHPVYRPTESEGSGFYHGICPRCGPAMFSAVGR